ncbi:MAG TPA: sulfatase-like hydrolase/transferase, partial [Chitinophagaceae bacterium]|nr:sulfatase-like hydrolase/transferase [Chitinophagaceae bacterium]
MSFKTHSSLILVLVVFLSTGPRLLAQSAVSDQSKPNVILILADDMGYGDLECYGGFPYHTPNINRLAAGGMRFTQFYAAQATCSASRAAILTGCYPNRIGISGALSPFAKIALNPKEATIASLLKARGYNTG